VQFYNEKSGGNSNIWNGHLLWGAKTFRSCSLILCEIIICQLRVYYFWHCHGNRKFYTGLAKNHLFWPNSLFFPSFIHQIAEIHQFIHFISIMAWICINFRYFFSFKNTVKSKIADPRWRHTQQNCFILVEEAQSYLINVNIIRYENLGEWFHQPPPPSLYRGYKLAYTCPISFHSWRLILFYSLL